MNKRDKIFHPTDVIDLTRQSRREINIAVPQFDAVEEPAEIYTGPSPDEVRAEITQLREQWCRQQAEEQEYQQSQLAMECSRCDEELKNMRASAQSDAKEIGENAAQSAQNIIATAEQQAQELIENANLKVAIVEDEGRAQGFKEGVKNGYEQGFAEVRRLTSQLHYMISGVLQRREEIISSLENDLIDMTLLIARKVVKVLSENQKDIVVYNTLEALKKLRCRGSVTLRVNPEDLNVCLENKKNFISEIENLEGVQVVEDHVVQRGGCIVESDFGEIDARISSQLREVEDKILSVRPVRRRQRRLREDIIRQEEEELRQMVAANVSQESSEDNSEDNIADIFSSPVPPIDLPPDSSGVSSQ